MAGSYENQVDLIDALTASLRQSSQNLVSPLEVNGPYSGNSLQ